MAFKPRHKRRLFWTILCTICALLLSIVIIPPMITLNTFKPAIEQAIYNQMSVPAKLNGDIHFSLIGGATIVAHDVSVPTADIGSVMLSIPFSSFFDLKNAQLKNNVSVYDADIKIEKLSPAEFNHNISIYNSKITFAGRKFKIIRANFTNGEFHGTIRTREHKYDVEFIGDTFRIRNKDNNLEITGQMYSDGSIRGHLSLETENINDWFGFKTPQIDDPVKLSANFEWDGTEGYKLTNIESDNFSGNIDVLSSGERNIQLVSDNLVFDFSFLTKPGLPITKTNLNLDFYGELTFGKHTFHHLRVNATGTSDKLQITNIIADDIAVTGGTITPDGAENIMITMPVNNTNTMCLFSGTPNKWQCSKFTYGNLSGNISVNGDEYNIYVTSPNPMPEHESGMKLLSKLGTHGTVKFEFTDIAGTYQITPDGKIIPSYTYARNKTLKWLNTNIPFLPSDMLNTPGDFSWKKDMLTFVPYNHEWQLSTYDNYFYLSGISFKYWLPNIDLRFIDDAPYIASGFFSGDKISNLTIEISDHKFTGSASGRNITLTTPDLSLDKFISKSFINDFSAQEFLTNDPVLTLFNLPVNIALSADKLIYNGSEYQNFVFSLTPNTQTFSITDSARGNLLATIERNKTTYDIFAQLNRFLINGNLLSDTMPLNISDTTITGQIILTTYGQIAHDIYYNMLGTLDLTFSGGNIIGMSFDEFYASAENITTLNAEYALANALSGGATKLKSMHIIGEYKSGNFITTAPITLSMRHTDAIGGLAITDGYMTAEFDLTLRGTAPTPATIALSILPDGGRNYSLSDIMRQLDTGFMRAFVKTHDKF